jgi:lipid II:glycine glycyltransferase (peptidoglycan interpeptide bridge formation enzyme)
MTAERQWRYAEVRGSLEECAHELSQPSFFGHSLEFQGGEDALFANLEGSTRRAIRSATKNGLVVKVEGTEGALEDFYKLHVGTRKRHGAPPQPWRFFKAIQEELFTRGFGFVVSARDSGGKCLAAAVFLKWGKNALYKFGASNADALPLRPNHLVMWEAIRRLLAEGVTNLDFGRTSLDNKGLRRFKLSWGATERPIVYLRISGTKAQSLHARIMGESFSNRVFRALPATINRLAGAMLYKHLD